MLLENIVYEDVAKTTIKGDFNGETFSGISVSTDNLYYNEIIAQSITPDDYSAPDMSLAEFRAYRKAELNRIDTEVANAERWDTFTAQQKANVRSRKQKLRDLPASVNLTGVPAGDKAAAEAKFATTPALP